jgi:hypothetical protein
MKSITETLGDCQLVFGISYDIQEIFEGYVTNEHRTFIQLQVIEEFLPACDRPGSLLGRKSYDETAIEAREKATNTKKEVKPKGKRGRPKKGSEPRDKKQSVLEKQLAQSAEQAIGELNTLCSWGCKRNS